MATEIHHSRLSPLLLTDTFENQRLPFIQKYSSGIDYKQYPIWLFPKSKKALVDFKKFVVPILAETSKSPSQMLNLQINQIPHRSILLRLDKEYKKALENYQDSFKQGCIDDNHSIEEIQSYSVKDPISMAKAYDSLNVSWGLKILIRPSLFLAWFVDLGFLTYQHKQNHAESFGCLRRLNSLQKIHQDEITRINQMKDQMLKSYAELSLKAPQSLVSYTVTVREEKSRLEHLFKMLYQENFPKEAEKYQEIARINQMKEQMLKNYEELLSKDPNSLGSHNITIEQEKFQLEALFKALYHESITNDFFGFGLLFKEPDKVYKEPHF